MIAECTVRRKRRNNNPPPRTSSWNYLIKLEYIRGIGIRCFRRSVISSLDRLPPSHAVIISIVIDIVAAANVLGYSLCAFVVGIEGHAVPSFIHKLLHVVHSSFRLFGVSYVEGLCLLLFCGCCLCHFRASINTYVHGPYAGHAPLTEASSSRRGAVRRDPGGNHIPGDSPVHQPLPGKLHACIEEPWRSWRRGEH